MPTVVIEINVKSLKVASKLVAYFKEQLKGTQVQILIFKEPPTYGQPPISEFYIE